MSDVFDELSQPEPTQAAQSQAGQGDVFDELDKPDTTTSQPPAGEQVNDIGKTVIVPKEGETFRDTMARAAAQGKKTTQQDINDEIATAPKKVATTLAAAPVIGAAGTASLAAPAEIPAAAEKILQLSETALNHLAENYPHLAKLAEKLGYGAGAVGAYKLLNKLGIH